jgi:pilus assembly protein CpaF
MRPDRLIVGEVRGAEALDLLQALNTGHEGSVSTVHANTPRDALHRIATLALFSGVPLPFASVADQVRSAVDGVVQVERGRSGERRIVAIAETSRDAALDVEPLFTRVRDTLRPVRAPSRRHRRRDAPEPDGRWFT